MIGPQTCPNCARPLVSVHDVWICATCIPLTQKALFSEFAALAQIIKHGGSVPTSATPTLKNTWEEPEPPILATYVIRFRAPRTGMSNTEMEAALALLGEWGWTMAGTIADDLRAYDYDKVMANFTVEIEPA